MGYKIWFVGSQIIYYGFVNSPWALKQVHETMQLTKELPKWWCGNTASALVRRRCETPGAAESQSTEESGIHRLWHRSMFHCFSYRLCAHILCVCRPVDSQWSATFKELWVTPVCTQLCKLASSKTMMRHIQEYHALLRCSGLCTACHVPKSEASA